MNKKIVSIVIISALIITMGTFSIFGDTIPSYSPSVYGDYNSTDGFINAEVRVVSFNPYYEDFHFTNYRDFEPHYTGIVKQDYFISVTLRNRTNTDATCANNFFGALTLQRNSITYPPTATYHYTFACDSNGWSIKELSSNIATIYIGGGDSTSNTIQIIPTSDLFDGPQCAIPANSKITFYMILTNTLCWKAYTNNDGNYLLNVSVFPTYSDRPVTSINYNVNQNWVQSSHPIRYQPKVIEGIEDQLITVNAQLNDIKNNQTLAYAQRQSTNSYLNNIDSNVQTITDAYTSNINNITDTQSNINDTNQLTSDLHDQELKYYQQNEQALYNVGLSNFSFNNNESAGLGTVVTDFTTLWNNIGPLQIIFTFTLSLSLATYLLRHRPITNAIKKNNRK